MLLKECMEWAASLSKTKAERSMKETAAFNGKIVVLDDDPTGVQTVHGINVYTDWSEESIRQGFEESGNLFFILTNSRSLIEAETIRVHREIGRRVASIAKELECRYLIISRSDSTLRGHYPLETQVLREEIESLEHVSVDGEIICPFFPEGGRYTVNGVHYVTIDGVMYPAGETEFAKDVTFGYKNSHLGAWVEEKTKGAYPVDEQFVIPLEWMRRKNTKDIASVLMGVTGFRKVLVDALEYEDLFVFSTALNSALAEGKRFIIRSAAGLVRVLGGIEEKAPLGANALIDKDNQNGGLVIIGSHVQKTSVQLKNLIEKCRDIVPLELNCANAENEALFEKELVRLRAAMDALLRSGRTVVAYTSRELLVPKGGDGAAALRLSVRISQAVTSLVSTLTCRPRFLIAKGGITSSEIGVKGLGVKKAAVIGHALPGVPVWKLGKESRFFGLPYIIFPGNVGDENALYELVHKMLTQKV